MRQRTDLVSVTVSGGYKPLYQDEWTRVPRMSSERLADDLSRRTLLIVICWSMSEGIDHPVKAYLLALYMDLLITWPIGLGCDARQALGIIPGETYREPLTLQAPSRKLWIT